MSPPIVTLFESERYRLWLASAIAVVTLLFYYRTTGYGFQIEWDDGPLVVNNPWLQTVSWENFVNLTTERVMTMYLPVQMASYFLDRTIWGLEPYGFHLTSVLLHSVNAGLVYLLVQRLGARRIGALFIALLFAFHPLQVEAVAWIADRKSLLATFFTLIAFYAYLVFREQQRGRFYYITLTAYLLAIFSKSGVIGFPLILLAYEWFLHGRPDWKKVAQLAPIFLLASVQFVVTLLLNLFDPQATHLGGLRADMLDPETLFGIVYPTMLTVYWKYIGMLLWPTGLSAYYQEPAYYTNFLEWPVLISGLAWGVLMISLLRARSKWLRFWTLFTLFTFLPYAQIIPLASIIYADRYLYLTSIGIFMVLLLSVGPWLSRWGALQFGDQQIKFITLIVVATLSIGYASVAWQRQPVWQSEMTLWTDTVKKSPNAYKAHLNLGVVYQKQGQLDLARQAYMAAYRIWQGPEVVQNLRMLDQLMR
jgi:tetratricopeptide (TPR) repeat protein